MRNDVVVIIPARYGSTRFPGKPLVEIEGKSMIRRVYEQASKVVGNVFVATDSEKIKEHVDQFGHCIMTSNKHRSGTDRCVEAIKTLGKKYKYVINIQGDEPFINPKQIESLVSELDGEIQIATQKRALLPHEQKENTNIVKVVSRDDNTALYFSRLPVPFDRDNKAIIEYYVHVGIYAFRWDVLEELGDLKPSKLEMAENLEQLRWLESGYSISVFKTNYHSRGIDVPDDLNLKN